MPPVHTDRRRELLAAWERRCRARGGTEHCSGADALFLVTALSTALRHASETPELGRAARTWGARFSAPVDALATLAMLRDALVGTAEQSPDGLPVPLSVLNRIFDQAALEAVDAASTNLRSEARNDPLTGCANRRALDEELTHAAASARRSNLDLAVAVIDLDGLKQINDTRGHAAGDAALVSLVVALRRALREADTLYRTGGDEFVVVAPFTDAAGARALMRRAERMGGPTFSWGVASLAVASAVATAPDTATLMDAADTDLYERRRATRRATALAARKRTATAVASVAASVAVTAAMAGLAVALDSGSATPASSTASGTAPQDGGGSGGGSGSGAGGSGAPRWAMPTFVTPGSATDSGASLSSQTMGGLPLGGVGSLGTSLVGLLETVVPPSALPPALPGLPAAGGISVTLPTYVVSSSGPIALASVPGPVTAASGTSGGTGGDGAATSAGPGGGGPPASGGGGAGPGDGGNGAKGQGDHGGGGVTTSASSGPGGGHGPDGTPPGRAKH